VIVERVRTPRGELVLRQVDEHFEVISNGVFLMDTRDGRSERLLATAALAAHDAPLSVLVGGLGVGFTLGAVCADQRVQHVDVVEIEPCIVEWQRSMLGRFSGHALDDLRVRVHVSDLVDYLESDGPAYDVICLDIDNGPDWTVTDDNSRLYGEAGVRLIVKRLAPGAGLSVWAARPVPAYEELLRRTFAHVAVEEVRVGRGEPDVVYLARLR
jgi:spermidine synthase